MLLLTSLAFYCSSFDFFFFNQSITSNACICSVCVCARARARVCVCVCARTRARVCVCVYKCTRAVSKDKSAATHLTGSPLVTDFLKSRGTLK